VYFSREFLNNIQSPFREVEKGKKTKAEKYLAFLKSSSSKTTIVNYYSRAIVSLFLKTVHSNYMEIYDPITPKWIFFELGSSFLHNSTRKGDDEEEDTI